MDSLLIQVSSHLVYLKLQFLLYWTCILLTLVHNFFCSWWIQPDTGLINEGITQEKQKSTTSILRSDHSIEIFSMKRQILFVNGLHRRFYCPNIGIWSQGETSKVCSEREGFGNFQACSLVKAAVESVWCGRVVLSTMWSLDGIACCGDSSARDNANDQWIGESGPALRFFLSEELSCVKRYLNFIFWDFFWEKKIFGEQI